MNRPRLLLAVGVVLALSAAYTAVTAFVSKRQDAAVHARDVEIAKLAWEARIHAPGNAETDYPLPLGEACRGNLDTVPPPAIALFWEEVPWLPTAYERKRPMASPSFLGQITTVRGGTLSDHLATEPPATGRASFGHNLLEPAWLVGYDPLATTLVPSGIRYLVTSYAVSLTPPTGLIHADVFDRKSGNVVCRGFARPRKPVRIVGEGNAASQEQAERLAEQNVAERSHPAFLNAAKVAPLEEICSVGGEDLCRYARGTYDDDVWYRKDL